jgi:alkylation response protein AidB-like acyl-CoA dehydrogenase
MGEVNDGWTVASRWMFHERVGHNSPYVTQPARLGRSEARRQSLARGRLDDPQAVDMIGESRILEIAARELQRRLSTADPLGRTNAHASAIGRLFVGMAHVRQSTIAFDLAGSSGSVWGEEDGATAGVGFQFLIRQTACIGGGTTEIARNVISERVLGMPREASIDKNVAFRDVPRGPRQRPAES